MWAKPVSVCAAGVFSVLCGIASVDAQTVVARQRLGNNTEGITFFPQSNRRQVAVTDGYDVFIVPVWPEHIICPAQVGHPCFTRARQARLLFNLRSLDIVPPRGIVYVPSQDRFYFSALDASRLHVTDTKGAILTPLFIQHSSDPSDIRQWEGLTYIPPESPVFPDTIAGITVQNDNTHRIQIVRLDGVVIHELVIPAGVPLRAPRSITYRAPDRLLLAEGNKLYESTFDGLNIAEVATIPDAYPVLEGLTTIDDGRIVAADYVSGRLYALDSALQRDPVEDRRYIVGLGIEGVGGLSWNSDAHEFLVSGFGNVQGVYAVSSTLNRSRGVVDLTATSIPGLSPSIRGLAYLPGEGRVAISASRSVAYFDTATGAYVSRLAFVSPLPIPLEITPLPGNLLGVRAGATPQEIRVVTRTGAPLPADPNAIVPTELPSILLSSVSRFRGLALYSGAAGDEIMVGLSFYDLSGQLLRTVDEAALGVKSVLGAAPISSGPHQGQFAAIESGTSELIIFSLP